MNSSTQRGAAFGAMLAGLWAAKGCAVVCVAGASPTAFADDLAVAAVGALLLGRLPAWLARVVVVAVLALAVLDVVLVRALGVPLLPSMLAGCAPAMADSFWPYATIGNAALACGCVLAAWLGARVLARRSPSARTLAVAAAMATSIAALSTPALAHRNGLCAFVVHCAPRASAMPEPELPRTRALLHASASPWHGCARGRSVVLVVLESAAARFVLPPANAPSAMPGLQRLLQSGLCCTSAWATYPESIEGQVALFCSAPPSPDAAPQDYAAVARAALPQRLAAHGYRSALFHSGRFPFLGMADVIGPMGFDVCADAATIGGERESSFGIDEPSCVDALLRWAAAEPAGQPLLLCWLPIAGHHPYASPERGPFPNDTPAGCSRNALFHADAALQRLWNGLCALRPPEQWLLCVVGDHGQAFGEHAGNFGHSFAVYEENLRVPLGFVAPGTALHGVHDAPCSHLDVVPALLDLLDLPGGAGLPTTGAPVCAFTDWGELLVAARDARWKLIHDVVRAQDQLFDLHRDPDEQHDVAAAEPVRVAELRRAALGFLSRARGTVLAR